MGLDAKGPCRRLGRTPLKEGLQFLESHQQGSGRWPRAATVAAAGLRAALVRWWKRGMLAGMVTCASTGLLCRGCLAALNVSWGHARFGLRCL